ncbi:hypothetical protein Q5P01_011591 [Channa striata]|uniref:Uncharacterized protein n=1 Tax=Channa striata TaxID=64152 RepID=A0AA88SQW7_CHASR|nr:hypothetical protein Q5P01_011591 [Channa striata]
MEKSEAKSQDNEDTRSHCSHTLRPSQSLGKLSVRSSVGSSRGSSASTRASMAAAHAHAEAQAAKARLAYAEKEMGIKVEQARLEATLSVLRLQREADAAMAKAEVLESAVAQFHSAEQKGEDLSFLRPQATSEQKVREFISKQDKGGLTQGDTCTQQDTITHQEGQSKSPALSTPFHVKRESNRYRFSELDHSEQQPMRDAPHQVYYKVPQPQQKFILSNGATDNTTGNLARFLAKSQLLTGGLTRFDDKPENYLSWKVTFQSTIADLGLTANEEINLLIKWLGPESSEQARRLKAVNIRHPSAGLYMIWTRLEECYESFPKLSSKDPHKLRELSDLLCELEAAKLDGYLPGLSYLDTARGVNPIVEKLPFHLQEKWTMAGSRYKEEHNVSFPPFSVFVEFVMTQAKARNDPSFTMTHLFSPNPVAGQKKGKVTGGNYNLRPSVMVHKTDVSTDTPEARKGSAEDVSKQCQYITNRTH